MARRRLGWTRMMCSLTRSKAVLRVADGKPGFYTWQFDTGASLRNWHQLKRSTLVPGFGSLFSIALSGCVLATPTHFPAHYWNDSPSWFADSSPAFHVFVDVWWWSPTRTLPKILGNCPLSHSGLTVGPWYAIFSLTTWFWACRLTRTHCGGSILFSNRIKAHEHVSDSRLWRRRRQRRGCSNEYYHFKYVTCSRKSVFSVGIRITEQPHDLRT